MAVFPIFLLCAAGAQAQQQRMLSDDIRSLQVIVDDDATLPPIMEIKGGHAVRIEFDEMSHDYHRFVYHIQHCQADWEESSEIFESDFLAGFNDQPIEDYENSFNTTQLYTHYTLTFPNENTRLRLSGNYRVQVFDDDDREQPVLEAEFCLVEPQMSIQATLSPNTDIDFNEHHQQISFSLSYGSQKVVDPMRELHTVVMQNRQPCNKVVDLEPNIRRSTGLEWNHRRQLIFPAGNEFHKFEILDMNKPGMNIDRIRWSEPYYHTFIYPDRVARNYATEQDQNGAFIIRNTEGDDNTEGEYMFVHFILESPEPLSGGDIYVCGQWSNPFPDEACRMEWDEENKCYEAVAMLKQGYYNYEYRHADGTSVDGNFYQTENEYIILVYHRPQGARYDALVACSIVTNQ